MINETFQARDGMPPELFPPGIPIYTGHYHKPHTVQGTEIHYVGSPYQGGQGVNNGQPCRLTSSPTR